MKTQSLIQEVASAIIAVLTIVGAFLLVMYDTVNRLPNEVPMWITLLIGLIAGAYFTRAASVNGARQAGVAAAQSTVDRNATITGGSTNVGSATDIPGSNG